MRGSSPILVTAALSLAVLLLALGVHLGARAHTARAIIDPNRALATLPTYLTIDDRNGNGIPDWQDELTHSGIAASTSTDSNTLATADPLTALANQVAGALYGGYLSLKQNGEYSSARAATLGTNIATNLQAPDTFVPHTVDDLTIDEDTTEARILKYRADLRVALAPMVTDDPPEIEYFASYVVTKDPSWITKLSDAAARYAAAEKNMLTVSVPKDGVPEHLRALNALGAYASTLNRMPPYMNDTFASLALLKTLNADEEDMLRSFDALAQYYVRTVATK